MSYYIGYPKSQKNRAMQRKKRITVLTTVCFIFFLFMVNAFWENGSRVLSMILWPVDMSAVDSAVQQIYNGIQSGQTVPEAIQSFCRETIYDALAVVQ